MDSKSRALVILSQDLLECKRERDEYKLVSDQVKEKYSSLKKRIDSFGSGLTGMSGYENSSTSFAQILCQLKDQNKSLLYELEETQTKLIDCEGDVRMLRGQLNSIKRRPFTDVFSQQQLLQYSKPSRDDDNPTIIGDKHSLVAQLELIKNRNLMLEKDMQSLLDEKEELVVLRDAYKAKVERLNERLNQLLRASSTSDSDSKLHNEDMKTLDIEGIIDENNFLRGKIKQLEEEKDRQKNILARYRAILEKSNTKNGSCFPPDSKIRENLSFTSSNVISSKQVQHFIASNNLNNLQLSQSSLAHLKSLVIALFEALTDKSTALALQRKNNRLLGERLEELEEKIRHLNAREKVFFLMRDEVKDQASLDTSIQTTNNEFDDTNHSGSVTSENVFSEGATQSDIKNEFSESDSEKEDKIELPSNLKALVDEESAKIRESRGIPSPNVDCNHDQID